MQIVSFPLTLFSNGKSMFGQRSQCSLSVSAVCLPELVVMASTLNTSAQVDRLSIPFLSPSLHYHFKDAHRCSRMVQSEQKRKEREREIVAHFNGTLTRYH